MNTRRVSVLISLLVVGVLCLGIDVVRFQGVRRCAVCGASREYQKTCFFVFGFSWEDERIGTLIPSRFEQDFPEFHCDHAYSCDEVSLKPVWNSPLIGQDRSFESWKSTVSDVQRTYETDPEFRDELQDLIDSGQITRARVVELAESRCLDGGLCEINQAAPGEVAVLWLLGRRPPSRQPPLPSIPGVHFPEPQPEMAPLR